MVTSITVAGFITSGCTRISIKDVESPNVIAFLPHEIIIEVTPGAGEPNQVEVAGRLETSLVRHFKAAGFPCCALEGSNVPLNAARLRVEVANSSDANFQRATHVVFNSWTARDTSLMTAFATGGSLNEESVDRTATAIVGQIKHYYASVGWDPCDRTNPR